MELYFSDLGLGPTIDCVGIGHRVNVQNNRLGEIAGEYVKKGSKLYVEGSLRTRKWQDPQGQDRYTTEIVASEIQMLDSKGSSSGYSEAQQGEPRQERANSAPATRAPATQGVSQEAFDELDDDIPF